MSKLETNTIDTVSGTSTLQVGSTNTSTITLGVSGDTVNVPSGVTINNNGTQTGFGGVMTPAFFSLSDKLNILLAAPRILKAPVGCIFSNFRKTFLFKISDRAKEGFRGVLQITFWILFRAA
jgi:hypothetical protein